MGGDVNTHVGGHLMSNSIDGWDYPAKITYDTDAAGKGVIDVSAKYFVLTKGDKTDEMPYIAGRCIVMHGVSSTKQGDRAAIGQIVEKNGAYTAAMGKYPGPNDLASTPTGTLTVTVTEGTVKLAGTVTGLGKSLDKAGIHIHTGEDCTGGSDKSTTEKVNAVVGGHLLSKGDGFFTTKYTSNDKGEATVDIATPANAYTLLNSAAAAKVPAVENHCIVIHDKAGPRIGIGQIKCTDGKCEAAMGAYPTAATAAGSTTAAAGSTTAAAGSTTAAAGTTEATGSATQMFTAFSALVVCAVLAF